MKNAGRENPDRQICVLRLGYHTIAAVMMAIL